MAAAQQLRDALARKKSEAGNRTAAKAASIASKPLIPLNVDSAMLLVLAVHETYAMANEAGHEITQDDLGELIKLYGDASVLRAMAVRGLFLLQQLKRVSAEVGEEATAKAGVSVIRDVEGFAGAMATATQETGEEWPQQYLRAAREPLPA